MFIETLITVSKGMGFSVQQPVIHHIFNDEPAVYRETLEQILSQSAPQLIFCIVSNNKRDRYAAIKKKCCVDRAVPSQVCLLKTLRSKTLKIVATKIAMQINCKLGGAPWHVEIPQLLDFMIVGFDVSQDTKNMDKNISFGEGSV